MLLIFEGAFFKKMSIASGFLGISHGTFFDRVKQSLVFVLEAFRAYLSEFLVVFLSQSFGVRVRALVTQGTLKLTFLAGNEAYSPHFAVFNDF